MPYIQYFFVPKTKKKFAFIREREKETQAIYSQHFTDSCLRLNPCVFVWPKCMLLFSCFCHFWNDKSESLGGFPVQFLDAHVATEKQTMEERR